MPLVAPGITNFNGGEWAPHLWGRTDLAGYSKAFRRLSRFIPLTWGSLTRTPGTRFVAATKNNGVAELIPFVFGTTAGGPQAYVLEFGEGYLRVFTNRGVVLSGSAAYEIASPYTLAQARSLTFTQSADTLFLFHPNVVPYKLTRSAHDAWTFTATSFSDDPASWTGSNWPAVGTFHEQRLWPMAAPDEPNRLLGSKVNNFETFTTGANDDDPVDYKMVDERVNAIRWATSHRAGLFLGTAGGQHLVAPTTNGELITPTNINVRRETTKRSKAARPERIDHTIIFIHGAGRRLYELAYSFERDAYRPAELTLLSRHLTKGLIRQCVFQDDPWELIWCPMENGELMAVTYMPEQQVIGCSRQPIGGTDAKVLSCCTIPGAGGDELWLLVERTINGTTKRYVEYLTDPFEPADPDDKSAPCFVDSSLEYDGEPTAIVSGLEHLEGETVQILADGARRPDAVVTNGKITLTPGARRVQVGLPAPARLETLSLEPGHPKGSSAGTRKRVHEATIHFADTLGAKFGKTDDDGADHLDELTFRTAGQPMDASPPLFTGKKRVAFNSGWKTEPRVTVVCDGPLPCTVLAITPEMEVS